MTGPELIENMGLDDLDQVARERSDPEWLGRWDRDWVEVRKWCVNHHLMHDDVEQLRRVHAFPRPVKLTTKAVAWSEAAVTEWLASRAPA